MNRPNANNAFMCLGLAMMFIRWTDFMVNLCVMFLVMRALRWAFFGR